LSGTSTRMQTDANSIHHCSANLNVTELQAATGSDGSCPRTAARSESAGRRSNSSQTARCAPSGNVFTAYSIMSKRITEEWTGDAMGFVARRSRGDAGPDEMRPSFEAETSDVDAFEQNPSSYGGCATMISRMIHELRYLEAFQFHHVRLPVIRCSGACRSSPRRRRRKPYGRGCQAAIQTISALSGWKMQDRFRYKWYIRP